MLPRYDDVSHEARVIFNHATDDGAFGGRWFVVDEHYLDVREYRLRQDSLKVAFEIGLPMEACGQDAYERHE
jgi:hypothetical protein